MYVNPNRQSVFLAHPRTASRAVRDALKEQCGFVHAVHLPDSKPNEYSTVDTYRHHTGLTKALPSNWTVFTTVRNHFDAWASWYAYKGRDGEPFDSTFIERIMDSNPTYWPNPAKMWGYQTEFATDVLRYESLATELPNLLGERIRLPVVGASEKSESPSPETRQYIMGRFGPEIAEYGYDA